MPQNAIRWDPEDILAALKKRHGAVTRLSEEWGYSRSAISYVLRNPKNRSRPLERRIAAAIGVAPADLWPDRYMKPPVMSGPTSATPPALTKCLNKKVA